MVARVSDRRGAVNSSPVTRGQARAFHLARHHLTERLGRDGTQAAAVVGLQDTPPGTAALSLAARADVAPDALDELVLVPSVRGAPLAVAPQDLAVFTSGLGPPDEAAAKVVVGNAWKSLDGITAMEALDRVSEAVHDSLRDGPLARDEDEPALVKSAKPVGDRLLANLDPLNAGRDRDLLVPDPAVRKRIWTVLGGPGIVLVDGDVMALWRSTKKGKKVLITVEPLGELTASAKDALTAEAERIAAFRGAETATVHVATP